MTNFGLDEKTTQIIRQFFAMEEQVEKVMIFGSRAIGNYKNSSDIDFAIVGQLSDKDLRHIATCLDELPTPYKFDVLDYNKINNDNLKQNIDSYGKVFYQKA